MGSNESGRRDAIRVADVEDIEAALCRAETWEGRVVESDSGTTISSSTPTSPSTASTTSEVASIAASSSSTTEAALAIATEATFAVATETIATGTSTASSKFATLAATSASATSGSPAASTFRLLELVVDLETLLCLTFTLALGLGFFTFEESSLLLFLKWLGVLPFLVLLLAFVGSTCLLGTKIEICHALGFPLGDEVVVALVVVLLLWLLFSETVAGEVFGWSS